jgi:long-subunit acyl-CoA synthetase (AMP-forming)
VLDDDLRPVTSGTEGELFIGGSGLARGYLREPVLTAERFIRDPFSDSPGARLYRTGDVVRVNAAGQLEFVRRTDGQVKVRGHRVELGEVEAALCAIPEIHEAVVLSRADASGENGLLAYIVTERHQTILTTGIRAALQKHLPEYMIPSAFMEMRELPRTPNGKTDRLALARLDQPTYDEVHAPYRAPVTPTQELLAAIWAEVFGLQRVGIDDDFFDLGGHSLLGAQILLRIRETTQKEITLMELLDHSTVAVLAELTDETEASFENELPLEV